MKDPGYGAEGPSGDSLLINDHMRKEGIGLRKPKPLVRKGSAGSNQARLMSDLGTVTASARGAHAPTWPVPPGPGGTWRDWRDLAGPEGPGLLEGPGRDPENYVFAKNAPYALE